MKEDQLDILYGIMMGILYDQESHHLEFQALKLWLDKNSDFEDQDFYLHIKDVFEHIFQSGRINYGTYVSLLIDIESRSKQTGHYEGLAQRVLTGLLIGITVDNQITDEELYNLYQWMRVHDCMNTKLYHLLGKYYQDNQDLHVVIGEMNTYIKNYYKH